MALWFSALLPSCLQRDSSWIFFNSPRHQRTHTEALLVDFGPMQISFADIVNLFWKSHDPRCGIRSPQYMTAIWFRDESQRDVINAAKTAIQVRLTDKVQTPVVPLDVFYAAEYYH